MAAGWSGGVTSQPIILGPSQVVRMLKTTAPTRPKMVTRFMPERWARRGAESRSGYPARRAGEPRTVLLGDGARSAGAAGHAPAALRARAPSGAARDDGGRRIFGGAGRLLLRADAAPLDRADAPRPALPPPSAVDAGRPLEAAAALDGAGGALRPARRRCAEAHRRCDCAGAPRAAPLRRRPRRADAARLGAAAGRRVAGGARADQRLRGRCARRLRSPPLRRLDARAVSRPAPPARNAAAPVDGARGCGAPAPEPRLSPARLPAAARRGGAGRFALRAPGPVPGAAVRAARAAADAHRRRAARRGVRRHRRASAAGPGPRGPAPPSRGALL